MILSIIFALAGIYILIQRQKISQQSNQYQELLSFGILGTIAIFEMLGKFLINIIFLELEIILLWNGVAGFSSSLITIIAVRINYNKILFIAGILISIWILLLFIAIIIFEIYFSRKYYKNFIMVDSEFYFGFRFVKCNAYIFFNTIT